MESKSRQIACHTKAITDIKFHQDGDVYFASSKDSKASMLNLEGDVLGIFDKHDGSLSTLFPKDNFLCTAGLDLQLLVWDVITGKLVNNTCSFSVVRGLFFDDSIYFSTDHSMNKECYIGLYDIRSNNINNLCSSKFSTTRLFRYNDYLIFSTTNGRLCKLDLRTNNIIEEVIMHKSKITNIRPSFCKSFFVTSSTDCSVKIVDSEKLTEIKRFDCEEPINCACITRLNDKLFTVGGIDARDVTTTGGKTSFDTNVYDVVTTDKIGSYATHFGTINTIDVNPQSTHYVSGGEDGFICAVEFGDDFFSAPFTRFN